MATDPFRQQPAEVKNNLSRGTGTEKIVHDHLKDPNHIITDDHIRNVVVGMSDKNSLSNTLHPDGKEENNTDSNESDLSSNDQGQSEANNHMPTNPWAIVQ